MNPDFFVSMVRYPFWSVRDTCKMETIISIKSHVRVKLHDVLDILNGKPPVKGYSYEGSKNQHHEMYFFS